MGLHRHCHWGDQNSASYPHNYPVKRCGADYQVLHRQVSCVKGAPLRTPVHERGLARIEVLKGFKYRHSQDLESTSGGAGFLPSAVLLFTQGIAWLFSVQSGVH